MKPNTVRIIVVCGVCLLAAYLYWVNGRSIFENRAAPTEAELQTIEEITAFEQQQLDVCAERLLPYHDRARELGVEIRPILEQYRAVNHHGLVERHDFAEDLWLPKFYSSRITVWIYRDGEPLTQNSGFFIELFWLVKTRKQENYIEFHASPFDSDYTSFDDAIAGLLQRAADFLQA